MSIQQLPTPVITGPEAAGTSTQDRWLPLARVAWLILAAATLAAFIAGFPLLFAQLQTTCTVSPCFGWQLTMDAAQELQRQGVSLGFYAIYVLALNTLFVLSFLAVAAVIMWSKRGDLSAVLVALVLTVFGAGDAISLLGTVWNLPDAVPFTLLGIAQGLLFFLFPSGKFVPRWTRWIVILVILLNVAAGLFPQWSQPLAGIGTLGPYVTGIGAQIYRYRRVSTSLERQQTKWAVFGIAVAIMVQAVLSIIGGLFPQESTFSGGVVYLVINTAWPLSYTLIPVSIGVAILRSRLYDIDVIIRRTLVYGALTATLALVYWGGVAGLQALSRPIIGNSNDLVIVVTTLIIAALFNPLRRRIQSTIDRRFYRRKYDTARTMSSFSQAVRDEVDLDRLTGRLVAVVEETMQPSQVFLWLRQPERGIESPQE